MNLRQVEIFKAIIEAGTVTAAARLQNISQPAATQMLAGLGRDIGFPLFTRIRRRLVPTSEGRALYGEVQRAFLGLEALKRYADEIRNLQHGHLVIGTMPALSGSWMPSVIARFLQHHSGARIALQTQSSSRIVELVARQQVDLGVAFWSASHDGVADEAFAELQAVCVLPAAHRLASCDHIAPADLRGEPFVSAGEREVSVVQPVLAAAGVSIDIRIEATFGGAACGMAAEGLGVTILDCVNAAENRHRGVVVRPFHPRVTFKIRLFRALHRPQSRLVDAFTNHLRTCAEADRLGEPGGTLFGGTDVPNWGTV